MSATIAIIATIDSGGKQHPTATTLRGGGGGGNHSPRATIAMTKFENKQPR
jgi:hypothetical protein